MRILLILLCGLGFFSCEKPCYKYKCKCIENIELPCYDTPNGEYFSGYIDGVEFCLADSVEEYYYRTNVLNGFTTTPDDPVLGPTAGVERHGIAFRFYHYPIEEYKYSVSIYSPMISAESFSLIQQLDTLAYFEYLPVRSGRDKANSYAFQMTYSCVEKWGDKENRLEPELFWIILSHTNPHLKQPKGSYIRVAEHIKTDLGYAWQYDITFEVKMKLSYYIDRWETFGTLDNAVLKSRTIVEK